MILTVKWLASVKNRVRSLTLLWSKITAAIIEAATETMIASNTLIIN